MDEFIGPWIEPVLVSLQQLRVAHYHAQWLLQIVGRRIRKVQQVRIPSCAAGLPIFCAR
jgi:hypothetical protein